MHYNQNTHTQEEWSRSGFIGSSVRKKIDLLSINIDIPYERCFRKKKTNKTKGEHLERWG